MNGISRAFIGLMGGFAAATSKILALDVARLGQFVETGNLDDLSELRVTIYIFTPLLMLLGGIVAWASSEEQRMKLLAIGCAAPALLAPWTAGDLTKSTGPVLGSYSIVTPAFAEETGGSSKISTFSAGVKALFGADEIKTQNYWVIVGSYKDEVEAGTYVAEINKSDPSLDAFVGKRKPDNEYYPIIVGGTDGYLPFNEATALREEAIKNPIIPEDSYLSNFPDR
ncbi:MAG: hypothetical protein JJ858_11650 [Rhizobiaceae bacterium]|nr:hypothetical protein [Rhizobiaceae bacterium]